MKRIFNSCFLLLLILGGLAAAVFAWVGFALPQQAERFFGPPSPSLGLFQRASLSAMLLLQETELKSPYNPAGAPLVFRVELGESTYAITESLQAGGLVANAETLRNYLIYTGRDTTIQAGEYRLSPAMSPIQIAHVLQDATPSEITFRILPGWRLEEIAASLPTSGLEFSPDEFLAAAAALPALLDAGAPAGASMEGFLFPDTYQLPRKISVDSFVVALLDNFQAKTSLEMRQGFSNQGLSLYQAVTLASMIQREAVLEDEMPMIASVFHNRLAAGMKLGSDPTVQYALGFIPAQNTWWKNPLSLDDLAFASPYNTYQTAGLPAGPICNPDLSALQAVAFPEQSSYYFFRAACDGSGRHSFAQTFEEHQQNACP